MRSDGAAGRRTTFAHSRLYQILAVSLVLHGALLWQLPFQADPEPIPEPVQRVAVTLVKTPVAPLEPTLQSLPVSVPPVEAPSLADAPPPKQAEIPERARDLPPAVRVEPKAVAPHKPNVQVQARQEPRAEKAPIAPVADLDPPVHKNA